MSASDLPQIMAIERRSFPDPWSEKLFAEELDGDSRRLNVVMKVEGRVVGYGLGWVVLDEFHLGNLAVDEEHRGRGYGRKILAYLLDRAYRRGCRICSLEVRVSNQRAISLYRSFGFREVALRPRYYGQEDALVMLSELPTSGHA